MAICLRFLPLRKIQSIKCEYIFIPLYRYERWCSSRAKVTRQVPLVNQEMLSLSEYMSSLLFFLLWVCVVQSLVFCVMLCWLLFVLFLLLVSVLFPLQFVDSEYSFVIFTMLLSRPLCCIPMLICCCRCFTCELSCLSGLFIWVMVSFSVWHTMVCI